MKKIFLLALLLFLGTTAKTFSQTFGVKGGGNVAMLNNATRTDAVLYFHTGVYFRESLEKRGHRYGGYHEYKRHRFFFQPELVYSRQGASLPDDDLWVKNDYVNLALMFQYMPVNKLSVEFGPQAGYMVISDVTTKWVGKKEKAQIANDFRKMDYALCFGISYRTWGFMDFACRYNLGLNDIVRNNTGKKITNGIFQLSMLIDLW